MTELPALPRDAGELIRLWLARKSAGTMHSYRGDLVDFARFTGDVGGKGNPDPAAALRRLLQLGEHEARALVMQYEADLLQRPMPSRIGYAASTINRRMSALRSVITLAETLGLCRFRLEIPCLPISRRGELGRLDHEGCAKIIAHVASQVQGERDDARDRARRDLAMVRLLWDMTMRRDEVHWLDYPEHVDLPRRVLVLEDAKTSQRSKLEVAIGDEVHAALELWMSSRGYHHGPLLYALDRRSLSSSQNREPPRLSLRGVNKIIERLAREAGLGHVRPHDFRRGSATRILDLTNGNVRDLQQQGRWSDPATAMRYDQRRREAGPRLPNLLGSDLPTPLAERDFKPDNDPQQQDDEDDDE